MIRPKIWLVKFLSDRIEKGIEPGLKTRKKDRFAIIRRMFSKSPVFQSFLTPLVSFVVMAKHKCRKFRERKWIRPKSSKFRWFVSEIRISDKSLKFGRFYQLPWQLAGLNILNMLVSYKWLKELVDIDVASAELAEKMSTTGIEVEGVTSTCAFWWCSWMRSSMA